MTINADCNNNKLEVSVTSNGLEVTSAASDETVHLAGSSSSSPSPDHSVEQSADQPQHHRPAPEVKLEEKALTRAATNQRSNPTPTKKSSAKQLKLPLEPAKLATQSEGKPGAKSPKSEQQKRLVQRHQSCPTGAAVPAVEPSAMAPSRPAPGGPVVANALPPIDNCDAIYAAVPLPPKPVLANGTAAIGNGVAPRRKEAATQQRSVPLASSKVPTREIDWKSKLNYELSMYQQMLQNQSRRSPLLRPSTKLSSHPASDHSRQTTPTKNYRQAEHPKSASAKTTTTVGSNGSTDLTLDYSWATDVALRLSPPSSASPTDSKQPRNGHFANREVKVITPYERILYAMEHDKTWQKEVAFGRRIGLYRFRGDIGNGNFSQVKIAVHGLTKEKVAVKILDKSRLDPKTQRMLAREIRTMETLHHPNLIRIFEVIETLSKHFIVMELAPGGELFQVISNQGRFSEMEAKFYFSQILSAIDHMHQHNLIHRDIKAENVFFADSYTVKVGDFGFSTRISSQDELLSTFCGSPPYAAPELFRDESYRGPYVDYWALGVLLYFIVTGTMPFRAQTIVALKKLILECRYDIPAYVSVECCQLIAGFLQPEPLKRYSLEQARSTRWLRNRVPVRSMPKYDMRSSYAKLLRHRRQVMAERRNTLTEFSTMDYDFTNRPNRFSLVESRSSPESGQQSLPPSVPPPKTPPNAIISDEERKTFRQLLSLGIDDEVITEHLDKGSLSLIVGTFRIVLHRYLQDSAKAAAALRATINDDGRNTPVNRLGRSTSIQVTAFDRFWANYARKSATPAIVPNSSVKGAKVTRPPTSAANAPPVRHALVKQTSISQDAVTTARQINGKVMLVEADRKSETGSANSGNSTKRSKFMKMIKPGSGDSSGGHKVAPQAAKSHSNGKVAHENGQLSANSKHETKAKSNRELDQPIETAPEKVDKEVVQRQKSHRSTATTASVEEKQPAIVMATGHSGTINSGRLSRSWRTIKNLMTENNICGNAEVAAGQLPTSLPSQADKSSKKSSTRSSPVPHSDEGNPSPKHHVMHKTATLQIVPNSCAALLWPPSAVKSGSMSARLRRSQTTPNVSTCYGGPYPPSAAYHQAASKKYNANNSRCIIF